MTDLLRVETIFFTVLGYPMSYLEFVGTLLYLGSVWLIARRNVLTWPVGIASVLLYLALFYQIRLYADAVEQVYYVIASVYGWWYWSRPGAAQVGKVDVRYSAAPMLILSLGVTVLLSLLLAYVVAHLHLWAPALFPEAASYPLLDATTTVMSLVAMWLMVLKRVESWIYWIVVDVVGIWLYFVKDVRFLSLLYVLLLGLALRGFLAWRGSLPRSPSGA